MSELLTVQQVATMLNISRRTIWWLVANGKFPKPIRLGARLRRWERAEIEAFLAEKKKALNGISCDTATPFSGEYRS